MQTFVAKNGTPGKPLEFTISGNGAIPREQQGAAAGQQPAAGMGAQDSGGRFAGFEHEYARTQRHRTARRRVRH